MATTGLGASLAEVYVMRSLHKQKLKKMEIKEQQEAKIDDKVFDEKKILAATGCFSFWVSTKTHSAKVSSDDSTEKPL
ncbi:hypothetical protein ERO13_D05G232600v2 [Gossypium hirsutum]|uniref:Uncharacterized protein n=3 Tax=Gossypium TaxID=3633 RepID=A0A5J5RI85_GOSBA|nr:hypothetical protein ES319_D05G242600v1 [Gossypium barbadense]KAG4147594.1 hypothetical protein ERO13_D05G232600v2 [Gossypium hirsutum]TYG69727.1 hypothetical protein ES288_D05G254300v1 [Gossypium darwinii]